MAQKDMKILAILLFISKLHSCTASQENWHQDVSDPSGSSENKGKKIVLIKMWVEFFSTP